MTIRNQQAQNPLRATALRWAAVLAACALALLAFAAPADALTTDRTTGRGSDSNNSTVLGGVPTRFTWEGTVGDDETVGAVSFAFPEGTRASDDTEVRACDIAAALADPDMDAKPAKPLGFA